MLEDEERFLWVVSLPSALVTRVLGMTTYRYPAYSPESQREDMLVERLSGSSCPVRSQMLTLSTSAGADMWLHPCVV